VLAGSRLADVVEEFNRHNERQLVIGDSSLAQMRISGVYASTDPALLVQFLREQPALRIEETESAIVITTR
jgi:ferric-dicitrate binding protein FerR (iron transport regulator)